MRIKPAIYGAVALVGSVTASIAVPAAVLGQDDSGTTQPVTPNDIEIELVEQRFAFGPDETIHLVYRLTGDLASIELVAPVTPEPVTTEPAPTEPAPTEPEPPESVPSEPVTTEPVAPVEPVALTPLSILVSNYPSLTEPADGPGPGAGAGAPDLDELIGGDVDRDAFGDAIDGIELADPRSFAVFNSDGSVTLTVDVPTDVVNSIEERVKFEQPGLYPLRTELLLGEGDDRTVLATHGTIVQRVAGPGEPTDPSSPINLTVVTAVAPIPPGATEAVQNDAAADFETAVDLAATLTSPLTLDAPPPIVAAAAASDDDAARLAESLAGDEFVAAPAVPLDVSSAVAIDRAELFARQLSAGEDILVAAVPTTPSRRDAWIAAGPLSALGAQELRDLGFRFLVMPQALYRDTIESALPDTDLFVEAALPDGGTLPMIVVSSMSEDLTPAATDAVLQSSTALEWAVHAAATLLVEQAADNPLVERSNVLSTPDLSAPDPRLINALATLADTTPSVRFVDASTITGTTDIQSRTNQGADASDPFVVQLPEQAGPALAERVQLLDATGLSMASAGSMLPADDPRPDTWAAQLEALFSTSYTDEQVATAITEIQAEGDALRDAVVPPEPFTFTLTGRSGTIEVRVKNTADESLDVVVRLTSPKVSFPGSLDPESDVGDHPVTLLPNDETSVEIPVRAKSNGTSRITVELLTPAGQSLGDPVTLTSRVTAFTGLGQVLTGGFVLVLVTWWFAQWRRRRQDAIVDVRERHPSVAK
jgi:Family of unknown function (DUF6049)